MRSVDIDTLVKAADAYLDALGLRPAPAEPEAQTDFERQEMRTRMSRRKTTPTLAASNS